MLRGRAFFISAASRSEMRIGFESLNSMPLIREMPTAPGAKAPWVRVRVRVRGRVRVPCNGSGRASQDGAPLGRGSREVARWFGMGGGCPTLTS